MQIQEVIPWIKSSMTELYGLHIYVLKSVNMLAGTFIDWFSIVAQQMQRNL